MCAGTAEQVAIRPTGGRLVDRVPPVAGSDPFLLLAAGPWRGAPDSQLLEALLRKRFPHARVGRHQSMLLVDLLTPRAVLAMLDLAARGDAWAFALCLKVPSDPRFSLTRVIEQARRSPVGLAVRRDRTDPAVAPVDAALSTHLALLRARRPAAWRAIDATRAHGTATAAAAHLGCSQQAVSRQLARSHLRITNQTATVLTALLDAPRDPGPS